MKDRQHVTRRVMLRLAACASTLVAAVAMAATIGVPAASAAPGRAVVRVPCTSSTLDVFSVTAGEVCYEGTGTIALNIPNVVRITTGVNTGLVRLAALAAPVPVTVVFHAHQTIALPRARVVALTITST